VFANVPNNAFGPEISSMLRELPPEHFGWSNVSIIGPHSCVLTPAGYITRPHVDEPLLCVNVFHHIIGDKLWIVAPPTPKNLAMWETDPTRKKHLTHLGHMLRHAEDARVFVMRGRDMRIAREGELHACLSLTNSLHLSFSTSSSAIISEQLPNLKTFLTWAEEEPKNTGRLLSYQYWDGLEKGIMEATKLKEVVTNKRLIGGLAGVLKDVKRASAAHMKETNRRQAELGEGRSAGPFTGTDMSQNLAAASCQSTSPQRPV